MENTLVIFTPNQSISGYLSFHSIIFSEENAVAEIEDPEFSNSWPLYSLRKLCSINSELLN